MFAHATLSIDLDKIAANSHGLVAALGGIHVVAVTKLTCGSPEVGRAMLAGGAKALGDSRLENVERLRTSGITTPIWLLRSPTPDLASEVVRLADISLESELETVLALERAAAQAGKRHGVIAMVDLGDLRGGVLPSALPAFVDAVDRLVHVDLSGIGVHLGAGAVRPTPANLDEMAVLAGRIEHQLGRHMAFVSGGDTGSIGMVLNRQMPSAVNTLRIGEGILMGVDTLTREPVPLGLHLDAFVASSPVIESSVRPTRLTATPARSAIGNQSSSISFGLRRRAICDLELQGVPPEGFVPVDPSIRVLGASTDDLLVVDVDDLEHPPAIGDVISFVPNPAAAQQLFASPHVQKVFTPLA